MTLTELSQLSNGINDTSTVRTHMAKSMSCGAKQYAQSSMDIIIKLSVQVYTFLYV